MSASFAAAGIMDADKHTLREEGLFFCSWLKGTIVLGKSRQQDSGASAHITVTVRRTESEECRLLLSSVSTDAVQKFPAQELSSLLLR